MNRPANPREVSPLDGVLSRFDQALRTILSVDAAARPNPANTLAETATTPELRAEAARLMRVNHAGEVAAQALYHGQALTAQNTSTRDSMMHAAQEETDHLSWCSERIAELGGRPSLLSPLWYAGSFFIGAAAGLAGDRTSLGFVAETERQVVKHLDSHLRALPADDFRSRAILEKMRSDEAEHGHAAEKAGGEQLPSSIRTLMSWTARVMTRTAYWV